MAKTRKGKKSKNSGHQRLKHRTSGRNSLALEGLEDRLLLASDWQNPGNPLDVDDNPSTSFEVAPIDANIVITELNNRNFSSATDGSIPPISATDPAPQNFIDVTGDMFVTPLDAVRVINRLNADFSGGSTVSYVAVDQITATASGNDSMVNPTLGVAVNNPSAATGDDRTVFVWEQFDQTNRSWAIFAQRYDATGTKIGDAIEVSGGTDLSQRHPEVAVNSIGAFAVTWQSETANGDWDIHAKSYTRGAVVVSEEVRVNQTTAGNQVNPDIAFGEDGTFAVVWEGNGVGDHNGIFERELFLTGLSATDETLVNRSLTEGRQSSPAIAGNSQGRFIVAWDGPDPDNVTADAIFASLDAGPVAIARGSNVSDPALSVASDDSLTVAWRDGDGIVAQSFHSDTATGPELSLSFQGLEPLGSTHNYEAWVIVDGAPVTAGVFDVNSLGDPINSAGEPARFFSRRGATDVVISIEPENDTDPAPANTKVLGGAIDNVSNFGKSQLVIDHPAALNTDFSTASGGYILATPTTAATDDELSGVWFIDTSGTSPAAGLNLPTLPAGWAYEGWAVIDGQPVSTGRFQTASGADDFSGFSGPEAAPPFPGEDFVQNEPAGLTFPTNLVDKAATIVVSVEPVPDNSAAPFALKPLADQVPATAVTGVNETLGVGSVAVTGNGSVEQFLPAGDVFTVTEAGVLSSPSIARIADGSMAISWAGTTSSAQGAAIQVLSRAYNPGGVADRIEFSNRTTLIGDSNPVVAALGSEFVTAWQGQGPSETSGIFARQPSGAESAYQIVAIADLTISEGATSFTQTVNVQIVDGDVLPDSPEFTLSTNAPGATIHMDTGVISIPISESTGPGTYNFTVTARDEGIGQSDSESFTLTVTEFNVAPVLNAVADQSAVAGTAFSLQVPAASDSDLPANALSYSASQSGGVELPDWLTFDAATRTFAGTPVATDIGSFNVMLTVSDGELSDTDNFQVTVNAGQTNASPTFGSIPNQAASANTAFSYQVPSASDPDTPGESLMYSATVEGGLPLPGWLSFDGATRTFSGTPTASDAGNLVVIVSASDGATADFTEFQILVETSERFALNAISPVTTNLAATPISFKRQATLVDRDGVADSPTYSVASNTLSNVSIDSATGEITVNVGPTDGPAFHLVTVTATEGTFSDSVIFTVAVNP